MTPLYIWLQLESVDVVPRNVPLTEIPERIGSHVGLVTLSATGEQVLVSEPRIDWGLRRNQVLAVTAPSEWIRQPWKSRSSADLLLEVAVSLSRVGIVPSSRKAQIPSLRSLRGGWAGWRNFSARSKKRSIGEAISGSLLSETLETLDETMPNYAAWLVRQIKPLKNSNVLEIGAGTGTISVRLAAICELVAYEPSSFAFSQLKQASLSNINQFIVESNFENLVSLAPFDQIVLVNVLEHVEDDCRLLAQCHDLLRIGGRITVLSPAHNCLYSKFDQQIGHVRRYTKKSLNSRMQYSGFVDARSRYFNALGAPLWLVSNRLLGTVTVNRRLSVLYDRVVVPISKLIELVSFRPFGQSVVSNAKKASPAVPQKFTVG